MKKRDVNVREEPGPEYGERAKGRTSNAQRPTSNVQRREGDAPRSREKKFDLEERLLEYAVRIVRLVDALPATRAGRHVADQLMRCGTSPLANHGELQGAESRKDFIHKLGLCLKEIRESRRWLRLVHRVPLLSPIKVAPLIDETEALIKIFAASIRTAKRGKE
jgi:four helix bundle protein